MTPSSTAHKTQITGPQEASIHSPMAANGKSAASTTLATCQCTGIRSKRHNCPG